MRNVTSNRGRLHCVCRHRGYLKDKGGTGRGGEGIGYVRVRITARDDFHMSPT